MSDVKANNLATAMSDYSLELHGKGGDWDWDSLAKFVLGYLGVPHEAPAKDTTVLRAEIAAMTKSADKERRDIEAELDTVRDELDRLAKAAREVVREAIAKVLSAAKMPAPELMKEKP